MMHAETELIHAATQALGARAFRIFWPVSLFLAGAWRVQSSGLLGCVDWLRISGRGVRSGLLSSHLGNGRGDSDDPGFSFSGRLDRNRDVAGRLRQRVA